MVLQSIRPEFEEGEYIVRRRYNDFIWLRQKLVEMYPTYIVPVRHFIIQNLLLSRSTISKLYRN